ncbi:hypothetical protein KEM56_007442 [Ascosphaera pollenicola]|nr:hypothetical protein KEM56_007442 [Ascosphaera pollenicola]
MGKRQHRQTKKLNAGQPSDYETDTQEAYPTANALDQSGNDLFASAVPEVGNLFPDRSNEELNIKVVQRYNPEVYRIMSLAPYAVVYNFNTSAASWEKSGIEGTMFVCELVPGSLGEERYTVFVLNRRGMNNFECQLIDGSDVELTPEYIILKIEERGDEGASESDPSIVGLWIYTEAFPNSTSDARALNAQIIKECASHAGDTLKLAKERLASERKKAQQPGDLHSPGRTISLHEMFGQQRQQDDAWTVRAHDTSPNKEPLGHIGSRPEGLSAAAGNTAQPYVSAAASPAPPVSTGNPVLDQLFAKAAHGTGSTAGYGK